MAGCSGPFRSINLGSRSLPRCVPMDAALGRCVELTSINRSKHLDAIRIGPWATYEIGNGVPGNAETPCSAFAAEINKPALLPLLARHKRTDNMPTCPARSVQGYPGPLGPQIPLVSRPIGSKVLTHDVRRTPNKRREDRPYGRPRESPVVEVESSRSLAI
jgi:hypothetical protein